MKASDNGGSRILAGVFFVIVLPAVLAGAIWFISRPKVVERNPLVEARLRTASIALIGVLDHKHDSQDAIDAYARVFELEPGCLEAEKGMGIAYVAGAKNPHQGLKHLLAYLKRAPEDAEANYWTGRGYAAEGSDELAIHFLGRACDLDRGNIEARREIARLHLARRKPLEASIRLQEALASDKGRDDEELQRLLTSAMEMQSAMARDVETRGGAMRPTLGPELPHPLSAIRASQPKVPEARKP